jgi:hypothetical protein
MPRFRATVQDGTAHRMPLRAASFLSRTMEPERNRGDAASAAGKEMSGEINILNWSGASAWV